MCWMFDIHIESELISQRGPCLSAPCSWEAGRKRDREGESVREREGERRKNKSIWKLIHGQLGHGRVGRRSHIMMFDQEEIKNLKWSQ